MIRPLKLFIVDDIRSVVDMIRNKIPWSDHGIEVAGSALNGEEALKLIREAQPDIVLTDIRMPKMDGLEMTRQILDMLPNSKIIILSAYTDFEYAQRAIQYGAVDYIKKPFSVDQIVNVVKKAKEVWETEQLNRSHVLELERKIKESMPALRQEYLSLLVHHQTEEKELQSWWGFLDMESIAPPYVVMTIQIDQFTRKQGESSVKDLELIRFSLQNIVEETIHAYTQAVIFREAFNRYICMIQAPTEEMAVTIAESCCRNIAAYTKFTISIGIGSLVATVRDLPRSYQQSLSALSYHFYTGGNGAFSYKESTHDEQARWVYTEESASEFLFAFRSGNRERCMEWATEVFDEMGKAVVFFEPIVVEGLLQGLALRMMSILLEKFPRSQVEDFEQKLHQVKQEERTALQEYRDWFLQLCEIGCRIIMQERTSESQKIIYRSVEYIQNHLHLDLTLEHCAKQVNLSWGYYSNLFKKVMGTPFQQFVTQAKMERAKSMLIEDYQVQEIAQQLGYEHRRYFSEVFKKQVGQTPTEFKEASLGKSSQP
ncbi:response regulator [Paenibacillus silviterrae]|uniref:response regulator n=1 Tax=Paenibacillus silviterrae TaxID=3242194 RepID=UPI002542A760|nr:response regulator [Paenibacillus chinjuensis]